MEGSGIGGGVAAANGGDAGGDALGQNGHGENGNADFAAVMDQLSQMSSSQDELRQFLTAQPFQPQAGNDLGWAEGDGLDAAGQQAGWDPGDDFGEGFGDELTGDPVRDAQVLGDHFDAAMQHHVEQAVAPLREHMAEMERVADARDLTMEFPELSEPDTAKQVLRMSSDLAQAAGHPEIANEPWLWRLVYAAGRAYDAAAAESAESPDAAAHLEGGGGAGPGSSDAPSMVDQILTPDESQGLGRRVLPFST
jgi:hypothetical protein